MNPFFNQITNIKKPRSLLIAILFTLPVCFTFLMADLVSGVFAMASNGVYGIYFDDHGANSAEIYGDHPLLSGVFIKKSWAIVNPEENIFDFSSIESAISKWSAYGKKIIIGISPMGQKSPQNDTPQWLYATGVNKIVYFRNGYDDGHPITVPKTWDEMAGTVDPTYFSFYSILVHELAEHFRDDPRVQGVMVSIGHLGTLTANPSKGGKDAFLENGWSIDAYKDLAEKTIKLYRQEFPNKILILLPTPLVIREKLPPSPHKKYFKDVISSLAKNFAQHKNSALFCIGLDQNVDTYLDTGLPFLLAETAPLISPDKYQQGIGDDWPLYCPHFKRGPARSEEDFENCVRNAVGGFGDIPKTNITAVSFLEPTLQACFPGHPKFNQTVYDNVIWLLDNILQETEEPQISNIVLEPADDYSLAKIWNKETDSFDYRVVNSNSKRLRCSLKGKHVYKSIIVFDISNIEDFIANFQTATLEVNYSYVSDNAPPVNLLLLPDLGSEPRNISYWDDSGVVLASKKLSQNGTLGPIDLSPYLSYLGKNKYLVFRIELGYPKDALPPARQLVLLYSAESGTPPRLKFGMD